MAAAFQEVHGKPTSHVVVNLVSRFVKVIYNVVGFPPVPYPCPGDKHRSSQRLPLSGNSAHQQINVSEIHPFIHIMRSFNQDSEKQLAIEFGSQHT